MNILLIGANGQVGWELNRTLQPLGDVVALDYPVIDLGSPEQIRERIREIRPRIIINAAAYTAVDKAEEERKLATAVNAVAPRVLAEEAKRTGAAIVHYSTDYVFDGARNEPYTEKDTPNPINTYGRSKLEGDRAIQIADIPYLILRTSWVYGARGKNFMLTVLRLAREKEEIRVVDDQSGSPTWCRMIAEATAQILFQGMKDPIGFLNEKGGLYNLSAMGNTSWFGFAKAILKHDPNRGDHKVKHLVPVSTKEYPTAAGRPAYSVLSCQRVKDAFGLHLPEWETALKLALDEFDFHVSL